jgi:trehalose/maltose hydrolase-like predicted phosphorylase
MMLFYLLSPDELTELLSGLNYECDDDMMQRTIEYYESRTAHGSTLSRVVHAWIHARRDRERSWHLFVEALYSDIDGVQTSTTKEGLHLGAMAGTIDLIQRCYTGIETRRDVLRFDPVIPEELGTLAFDVGYRGHLVHLEFTPSLARVRVDRDEGAPITIAIRDDVRLVDPGDTIEVKLAEAPSERGIASRGSGTLVRDEGPSHLQ